MIKNIRSYFQDNLNVSLCLVLGVIIFFTGYAKARSIGLYGDDWGAATFLFEDNVRDAVKDWWHFGSGEISNFRMLDSVLPILWFYAFRLGGMLGVVLVSFFIYWGLAVLLFKILTKSLSVRTAFFGSLLFALYPTNNAYLWHVTLSYSVALLLVFWAVLLFKQSSYKKSLAVLLASILVNEGVFFIYFLAMLPNVGENVTRNSLWANLKKWLFIVFGILVVYVAARVGAEVTGITGGNRAVSVLGSFNLFAYIAQFIKSFAVVLVIGFAGIFWKIYNAFSSSHIWAGVLTSVLAFVSLRYLKVIELNNLNEKSDRRVALFAVLIGLMLIVAGRYYGFYYVPSINILNLDSRYYFAASVGGAVFFAGVFEHLQARYFMLHKLWLIIMCVTLGLCGLMRFEVQKDYADATIEAGSFWKSLHPVVLGAPENSFLYVQIPERVLGRPVGLFEASGDLRNLLPKMYDSGVRGVTSAYVQKVVYEEDRVCLNSSPFYFNTCFQNKDFYSFEWKDGELRQLRREKINPVKTEFTHNIFKVFRLPLTN
ncbi:MAG: hypothetical protein JNN11_04355 [Candidatus Doudnabacteria bacterium]|nr:hypothetical protein [Candidatus Doudnabacteria bacterium]